VKTNAAEKKLWPNWNCLLKGATLHNKQFWRGTGNVQTGKTRV
jgi:hypothetical protein